MKPLTMGEINQGKAKDKRPKKKKKKKKKTEWRNLRAGWKCSYVPTKLFATRVAILSLFILDQDAIKNFYGSGRKYEEHRRRERGPGVGVAL